MVSKARRSVQMSAGFLLLDTLPSILALPAVKVLSVSRATEWPAEPPRPFASLLPIQFATIEPAWVLRIGVDNCSVTALINGKVRVDYVPVESLYSMPLNQRGFDAFTEVILRDGRPSALVVNVDALLHLHQE
jgi:hypothetical protein